MEQKSKIRKHAALRRAAKWMLCLAVAAGTLGALVGCRAGTSGAQPRGAAYFTFFDTVTSLYSYAGDSEQDFADNCRTVETVLETYHRLFDIYHEYEGVTNLATLNANAGGEALEVDPALTEFLVYAKEMYEATGGEMNVMMGAVLRLWHDCREQAQEEPGSAQIPGSEELARAAEHTDIEALEIDAAHNLVRIRDPEASLDVGALAKGYAAERAAQRLIEAGADGYVLDVGGNLRMIGHRAGGGSWVTGIKDPKDPERYAARYRLADTSCVTSGNYERYFTVDGVRYHHIIDRDTAMPAAYFSSVTVITPDSGLADALSTALFCMPYEDGLALAEAFGNVEVLWILPDGSQYQTPGLKGLAS